MKASVALLAVAVLAVGCSGSDSENVVVVGSDSEDVVDGRSDSEDVVDVGPESEPSSAAGLAHCDDVPRLGSRFEGTMGARQNPDPIVNGVLTTYAMEHPDTFGGRWIDRANGGALVLGFTDDPDAHRQAILARAPSPDDYPAVEPRPPITDPRPLGEREDVVIDVVRVRLSETEMLAMARRVRRVVSGRDFGLDGSGLYISRRRVHLDLVNPPEGAAAEIAELVPDASAVCIEVTRTPNRPLAH